MMARSYRSTRPRSNLVYSVEDVMTLYDICRNTLGNWISRGLRPVDDSRPQLFRGAELRWFHEQRAIESRQPYRNSEFKCLACKERVIPALETLALEPLRDRTSWADAACPWCNGKVRKLLNTTAYDILRKCIDSNMNLEILDEETGGLPVGIGKNRGQERPTWTPKNERIIYEYQIYCGRLDPKTRDAHLAAIRDFEVFVSGKHFLSVTREDAARYRTNLIDRGRTRMSSRSTVTHRASHLAAFFNWIVKRGGRGRLDKTTGDYFVLPRGELARTLQPEPRGYPTTEQALHILSSMPTYTLSERRDRAIVAASFVFGTRANATASLLLCHVDVTARKVYQDATIVRVKNGKSQITCWFPIRGPATGIVVAWVEELFRLGFQPQDAFFPPDAVLDGPWLLLHRDWIPTPPWKSDRAIRRAFMRGCKVAGLPYFNPHAARHYLRSVRDEYCKTAEERRAWSYNLGHENERITETHYAKMTDQHRDRVFDQLAHSDGITTEDQNLLLDYYEHNLIPGTPEFERAARLALERATSQRQAR